MNFNSRDWTFRPEVEGPSVVKIEKADGHRSVVAYLPQVKKWKNYPTLFDGVFS
jgi:hypothetical protein